MRPFGCPAELITRQQSRRLAAHYHRSERCGVVTYAKAQTLHAPDANSSSSPAGSGQVQLLWGQTSSLSDSAQNKVVTTSHGSPAAWRSPFTGARPQPAASEQDEARELTLRIKAARSWQQLQLIADENARLLNNLHISAIVTHMAQLHASCSDSSSSTGDGPGDHPNGPMSNRWNRHDGKALSWRGRGPYAGPSGFNGTGPAAVCEAARRRLSLDPQLLPPPLYHQRKQPAPPPQQPPSMPERTRFLLRLERAILAHVTSFSPRQVANSLWAFAKLGHRPAGPWLEAVLTRAHLLIHQMEPQHLANIMYALMLLRYLPPPDWLETFFEAVGSRALGFCPAEVAQLCYAVGKLGLRPRRSTVGALLKHVQFNFRQYGMRELTMMLYGAVHMGAVIDPSWLRYYRIRVLELVVESGGLSARRLRRMVSSLDPRGPLAPVVWARINLLAQQQQEQGQRQEEMGHGQGAAQWDAEGQPAEAHAQHRGKGYQLQTPRLLASEPLQPDSQVPRVLVPRRGSKTVKALNGEGPQAGALAASSGAGQGPTAAQLDRDLKTKQDSDDQPASRLPDAAVEVASYLPCVLLSMGKMPTQPPPLWMWCVMRAFCDGADRQGAGQLVSMLFGLALVHYRPVQQDFDVMWGRVMDSVGFLNGQQVIQVLAAAADLDNPISPSDLRFLLAQAASHVPNLPQAQLVTLLRAASKLRYRPRQEWLELLETHLYRCLLDMTPFEVADVLLHLATLGARPHRAWMARWTAVMLPRLPQLGLEHLSAVAAASARLRFRPNTPFSDALLTTAWTRLEQAVVDAAPRADGTPAGQAWQHKSVMDQRTVRVRLRAEGPVGVWSPEALSRLLWGLAMLDVRPSSAWMASYMGCLRLAAQHLSSREVSRVMWSMARLRHDPGPEWMAELARLAEDAENDATVGEDGGQVAVRGSSAVNGQEGEEERSLRRMAAALARAGQGPVAKSDAEGGAAGAVSGCVQPDSDGYRAGSPRGGREGRASRAGHRNAELELGGQGNAEPDWNRMVLKGMVTWAGV